MIIDSTGSVASYDGSSWSRFTTIPHHGSVQGLSCASSSFCAAVDLGGDVIAFDGRHWRKHRVDGSELVEIDCPSSKFCVALDGRGRAIIWDGDQWSRPTAVSSDHRTFAALDCFAATFCEAVTVSPTVHHAPTPADSYTYNGHRWRGNGTAPRHTTSISCPAAGFCVAVGGVNAATFDGHAWSSPTVVSDDSPLQSVICASADFCLAGTYYYWSGTYVLNGTTWSRTADPPVEITGVLAGACFGTGKCIVASRSGTVATYDAGAWKSQGLIDSAPRFITSIECPTESFCLAENWQSEQLELHADRWSPPKPVNTLPGLEISCPTETFCSGVAGDSAYTWDGKTWSDPVTLGTDSTFDQISCPTTTYCLAGGEFGAGLALYDGSSWKSVSTPVDDPRWIALSCGRPGHCLVSFNTATFEYTDGIWRDRTRMSPNSSVACAGESFCIAVNRHGRSSSVDHGKWRAAGHVSVADYPRVTCTSSTFCLATGGAGRLSTWNGSEWSAHLTVGDISLGDASCYSPRRCVAVWDTFFSIGGISDAMTTTAPHRARKGARPTLVVRLRDPSTGRAVRRENVELFARRSPSTSFHHIAQAKTNARGRAAVRMRVRRTMTYEWVYAGGRHHSAASSAPFVVRVARRVRN